MAETSIEWADFTLNPWEGCTRVSPGCLHCYAEDRDRRYHAGGNWGPLGGRFQHTEDYWKGPLRWQKRAVKDGRIYRVFCGSLCDILEEDMALCSHCNNRYLARQDSCPRCDAYGSEGILQWGLDAMRDRVFRQLIPATPNLIWLLLTKRIENAMRMLPAAWRDKWPQNVMLGFSAENNEWMQRRFSEWRDFAWHTTGIRTFVSIEPQIGAIDRRWFERLDIGTSQIDWVIQGFESGSQARAGHPDWARSVRDSCATHKIPYLFKQWGNHAPLCSIDGVMGSPFGGHHMRPVKDKHEAGRLLDGRTHDGLPAYWPPNVGLLPEYEELA